MKIFTNIFGRIIKFSNIYPRTIDSLNLNRAYRLSKMDTYKIQHIKNQVSGIEEQITLKERLKSNEIDENSDNTLPID